MRNNNQIRIKRQMETDKHEFIKQLEGIVLNSIKGHSTYGHKVIKVEEIGNVSRVRNS